MDNEPDIVQKLSVDFNVVNTISVDVDNTQPIQAQMNSDSAINATFNSNPAIDAVFNSNVLPLEVQLGTVYIAGGNKVLYASTATWNSKPHLISSRGYIYIYSDWGTDPEGRVVAGFKVGDGETRLLDLPFTDQMYVDHINDVVAHITQQERTNWNNKVSCSYSEELEKLIFSR